MPSKPVETTDSRPNILCCSGLDPSGGAGLQADIEAIAAAGAHALIALTATTVQDSRNAYAVHPIADEEFGHVLDVLQADLPIAAIKLGVLGSVGQAKLIARFVAEHAIPLITDPVLKAGGGARLAADSVASALVGELLPLTTVLTPNTAEAHLLCGGDTRRPPTELGKILSAHGAWVLLTGGDEAAEAQAPVVHNQLFGNGQLLETYEWPRLPHSYHGSGCTLASSIAAAIAWGASPQEAVKSAQDYTWRCLERGFRPGGGQHIPARNRP